MNLEETTFKRFLIFCHIKRGDCKFNPLDELVFRMTIIEKGEIVRIIF